MFKLCVIYEGFQNDTGFIKFFVAKANANNIFSCIHNYVYHLINVCHLINGGRTRIPIAYWHNAKL